MRDQGGGGVQHHVEHRSARFHLLVDVRYSFCSAAAAMKQTTGWANLSTKKYIKNSIKLKQIARLHRLLGQSLCATPLK
jgi:hypothetical protein